MEREVVTHIASAAGGLVVGGVAGYFLGTYLVRKAQSQTGVVIEFPVADVDDEIGEVIKEYSGMPVDIEEYIRERRASEEEVSRASHPVTRSLDFAVKEVPEDEEVEVDVVVEVDFYDEDEEVDDPLDEDEDSELEELEETRQNELLTFEPEED